jgi:hypothetical protein
MCVRGSVTGDKVTRLLASCVLLSLAAPASADLVDDGVRDNQLAVQSRLALMRDPSLAGLHLNLGVSVRDGVAAVWGTVPSVAVGRQAEVVVRRIPGVLGVRGEYQVLPPDDPVAEFLRRPPPAVRPSPPDELVRTRPGSLTARPGEWAASASPLLKPPLDAPPTVELQAPQPVTLGAPVPLPEPTPVSNLAAAVGRMVAADPRYRGVEPVVEGGLVRLRGCIERPEDVYALAQEISRLPGVERVVVDPIRTRPVRGPGAPSVP